MKRLRISVVGCGGITEHYLSVYRDLDWVDVLTCIDVDLERAGRSARVVDAKATSDFSECLDPGVDAVIINTPNYLHKEQAIGTLEAGKHVLVQKPLATNVSDALAITESAERAVGRGQTCGLYMSYFDQPLMHDFKQMIEEGLFGEITHFYARLMHRGGLALSDQMRAGSENWRGSIAKTGGGCFIQLGVHFIHLFEWLAKAPVVRVSAITKNLHAPGIEGEDFACVLLELNTGALITLDMSWCASGEQISIHGTRGSADYIANSLLVIGIDSGSFSGRTITYSSKHSHTSPKAPGAATPQESQTVLAPDLGDVTNPFNQQRQFLEAARDGLPAYVPISAGLADLKVVEAVYESARSNRTISIS